MSTLKRCGSQVVVAVALATFASGRIAAKEIEKAESRVEISDDSETTRIVNRTFEITEGHPPLLLRREIEHQVHAGYEGGPGKVRIDAWRLPRARGSDIIKESLTACCLYCGWSAGRAGTIYYRQDESTPRIWSELCKNGNWVRVDWKSRPSASAAWA
jgi:hypothetical protein